MAKASAVAPDTDRVVRVSVDKIDPNPFQPRRRFPIESIEELAVSIREHDLRDPIELRPKNDGRYELVDGERRLRAIKHLGLSDIKSFVREISAEESSELVLVKNIQRENFTVMEEATAVAELMQQYEGNAEQVAERIGKSVGFVQDRIVLLDLPEAIQVMLDDSRFSIGVAKALLTLKDEAQMLEQAAIAVRLNLNPAQVLGRIQRLPKKTGKPKRDPRTGVVSSKKLLRELVALYDSLEHFEFHKLVKPEQKSSVRNPLQQLDDKLHEVLEVIGDGEGE